MEKCEIEFTEESKIKMEAEEESVQKLGEHLGKLLFILECAGIPVTKGRKGCLLDTVQKLCFPIFIHSTLLYLLYATISSEGFGYATVIDTILPILTCVVWIIMRIQSASLKLFFSDLSGITSRNFKSRNLRLLYATNAGICFIFFYPLWLLAMRFAQGNDISVREVFRIFQEAIFPVAMVVVYSSVCYLLLQKVRFCKKMFQKSLDLTSPTAVETLKDYLNFLKCVECFESLLCNVIFVVLLHGLCVVSILVIDMFYLKDWVASIMCEALSEILYVFVSLGIMAMCAGNVTLEVTAIKSVLTEKMFNQLDQGDLTHNEQRVNLLLKKDVCVFTVGKAIVFNRGFILRLLLVVFAEFVVICQIVDFSN